MTDRGAAFLAARDLLLRHRDDYEAAYASFTWPELETDFNWARDYFDHVAASDTIALRIVAEDGNETVRSYAELATRSKQLANHLVELGLVRGDRVLVMLGNQPELWEMMLAAMRIGLVVIPATPLLSGDDLADRFQRGSVRMALVNEASAAAVDRLSPDVVGDVVKVVVGERSGWSPVSDASARSPEFTSPAPVLASDPLLEYFTSGTTSKPKLVRHSNASYPVGHLSTMYWLGVQPGDVHWTLSSPGWAKHAWGCFFAPFNAQATVFISTYERFDPQAALQALIDNRVTSICAPPTVWRLLIQEPLADYDVALRELLSAGEPLNPEVIAQVETAWGLRIRDGYGQTETTAQIGNSPGAPIVAGSMGRPLPGYRIALLDPDDGEADEGEIGIAATTDRPVGLMEAYADDPELTQEVMRNGWYHTGDVATRDERGYITYIGRTDDVFKSSGYRISPFELESVLIEHPAIAEAAVVPSPDDVRGLVPKAYVSLAPGHEANDRTAADVFAFLRERVSGYKRVRRLEFSELPKTISGKIRRVELRVREADRANAETPNPDEFGETDR